MAAAERTTMAPSPLQAQEQDAVIQERLAIPERSLKMLMGKMTAIAKANDGQQTELAIAAFALELEAFMLNVARIEAVAEQTTAREVNGYELRAQQVVEECRQTEESIASLKRELVDVRQDRQNKLAYDELANEITKFGTREELEDSLSGLGESIEMLQNESNKYDEIMLTARDRFETIAAQLEALRTEVGHEVGERERRAVERGREDADVGEEGGGGADGGDQQGEGGITSAGRDTAHFDVEHKLKRKASSLNPNAASFQPSKRSERSRDSSPGMTGRRDTKRTRLSRRNSAQTNDEDEDDRKSARIDEEEGGMSEVEEEEEEEGAA